jgi:hypothetical protein
MNHSEPHWPTKARQYKAQRDALQLRVDREEPAVNVTQLLVAAIHGDPDLLHALPNALAVVLQVDPTRVVVERRHEAITLRLLPDMAEAWQADYAYVAEQSRPTS